MTGHLVLFPCEYKELIFACVVCYYLTLYVESGYACYVDRRSPRILINNNNNNNVTRKRAATATEPPPFLASVKVSVQFNPRNCISI